MTEKQDSKISYVVTLYYLQDQNRPEAKYQYWIYPKAYAFWVTPAEAKKLHGHKGLAIETALPDGTPSTVRAFIYKMSKIKGQPDWLNERKHLSWDRLWNPGEKQMMSWENYQGILNQRKVRRKKKAGK